MSLPADRVAGALAVLIGNVAILQARGFAHRFMTEPVGPRGIPYLGAILLVAGGVWMILRPGNDPTWPTRNVLARIGAVAVTLLAYALLLDVFGFFVTTTLAMTALGVVYGAPWRRGFVASAAFTAVLYLLFNVALGLTLPIGRVFIVGS